MHRDRLSLSNIANDLYVDNIDEKLLEEFTKVFELYTQTMENKFVPIYKFNYSNKIKLTELIFYNPHMVYDSDIIEKINGKIVSRLDNKISSLSKIKTLDEATNDLESGYFQISNIMNVHLKLISNNGDIELQILAEWLYLYFNLPRKTNQTTLNNVIKFTDDIRKKISNNEELNYPIYDLIVIKNFEKSVNAQAELSTSDNLESVARNVVSYIDKYYKDYIDYLTFLVSNDIEFDVFIEYNRVDVDEIVVSNSSQLYREHREKLSTLLNQELTDRQLGVTIIKSKDMYGEEIIKISPNTEIHIVIKQETNPI